MSSTDPLNARRSRTRAAGVALLPQNVAPAQYLTNVH